MNTGVCVTCGATDVEVDPDTEQCAECLALEGEKPPAADQMEPEET